MEFMDHVFIYLRKQIDKKEGCPCLLVSEAICQTWDIAGVCFPSFNNQSIEA